MGTLVIVEDNPDNMKLFRALLARRGHRLVELASGEGLVDAVRDAEPDLVLLDIQLPDRDGYSLLAELRGQFGPDLRIVALTAHSAAGDREQALRAGFDGFITKPIDVRLFPDQVAAAIGATPG